MKFDVIYADPPWHYNSRRASAGIFGGGAGFHYPTMNDDEICALPVAEISATNAVLFLWVTFPHLQTGLRVIDAWGFTYKTCAFTWVKLNPTCKGVFFGVGYYTKSNAEICLLATRGKILTPAVNDISQVIVAPRREHSRKPDEAWRRIQRLYPDQSRIELFARETREKWACWGNELTDLSLQDFAQDYQADMNGKMNTKQNLLFHDIFA